MKWVRVEDALPEPTPDPSCGVRPTAVLVYSSHTDRYAIAEYFAWDKPTGWRFWHGWDEPDGRGVVTPNGVARRAFEDGALITHWAYLTRPLRRKGVGP